MLRRSLVDRWRCPKSLPAGAASGRALRSSGRAATDSLVVDPDGVVAAEPASLSTLAQPATVELTAKVSARGLRREIFGFLPYWELTDSSTRLDYQKLSTIAYFGVGADGNGNLQQDATATARPTVGWSGWTSSKMTSVINAAHASHTRVVLTVQSFAWTTAGQTRQKALLGSADARATSPARSPRPSATAAPTASTSTSSRSPPATTTSSRRSSGRSGPSSNRIHRGYQLTFDTTGWIGNYPIERATAPGGADAIFVMGYDYRTSGVEPGRLDRPARRPGYDIRDTIARLPARVAASKLILGVPYYGRAWSTVSATPQRHEHRAARSTAPRRRSSTTPRPTTRASTAAATTPARASPGPPTSARTAPRPTAA